jgi:hypothetical protein
LNIFQAAIEAIQRWSELHQKHQQQDNTSTITRDDQAYLSIVIKACYEVFDYPQGWLVDTTVFIFDWKNLVFEIFIFIGYSSNITRQ